MGQFIFYLFAYLVMAIALGLIFIMAIMAVITLIGIYYPAIF